jgi:hypothetical protein
VEERARERLPEAAQARDARVEREERRGAREGRGGGRQRRRGGEQREGERLPAEEEERRRADDARRGEPLGRVPAEAAPEGGGALEHAAARERRGVEEVGREARPAEGAREGEPVVERGADRGVPARPLVGGAPRDEELAAARGVGRVPARAHAPEGEESEEDEVDERDHGALEGRDRLLARDAAREVGARALEEGRGAREAVRLEAHVGVDEHEDVVAGGAREGGARVHLAAPAGRRLAPLDEADARVARRDAAHERGGAVARAVVEDERLEEDAAARERGLEGGADRPRLVARGDEERDGGAGRRGGGRRRRRRVEGEVPPEEERRDEREEERREGERRRDHGRASPGTAPPEAQRRRTSHAP